VFKGTLQFTLAVDSFIAWAPPISEVPELATLAGLGDMAANEPIETDGIYKGRINVPPDEETFIRCEPTSLTLDKNG
jgi:hypothetical protein